jgi:acetolactate synthase-1/2/3 large subunit
MNAVDPTAVVEAAVRAAASASRTVGVFAESSSAMFYVIRELCKVEDAPYARLSSHYGSMGHAIAGAVGFCAATGQQAIVVTGDGSFDLMNPMRVAVRHGLRLTMIVLNDSRLTLPYLGAEHRDARTAQEATHLAPWDFTRQGSPQVGGRRVDDEAELDDAIAAALAFEGCYVIDAEIDPDVAPPVGARIAGADALFGAPSPQSSPMHEELLHHGHI